MYSRFHILLFHDGGPYHIETGFYMIGASVMKEINIIFFK